MSLIQSARLNGHEPYTYLKDVLTRRVGSGSCCLIGGGRIQPEARSRVDRRGLTLEVPVCVKSRSVKIKDALIQRIWSFMLLQIHPQPSVQQHTVRHPPRLPGP